MTISPNGTVQRDPSRRSISSTWAATSRGSTARPVSTSRRSPRSTGASATPGSHRRPQGRTRVPASSRPARAVVPSRTAGPGTSMHGSLAHDGNSLFVGGNYFYVNGTPRNTIARVTLTDGSLLAGGSRGRRSPASRPSNPYDGPEHHLGRSCPRPVASSSRGAGRRTGSRVQRDHDDQRLRTSAPSAGAARCGSGHKDRRGTRSVGPVAGRHAPVRRRPLRHRRPRLPDHLVREQRVGARSRQRQPGDRRLLLRLVPADVPLPRPERTRVGRRRRELHRRLGDADHERHLFVGGGSRRSRRAAAIGVRPLRARRRGHRRRRFRRSRRSRRCPVRWGPRS